VLSPPGASSPLRAPPPFVWIDRQLERLIGPLRLIGPSANAIDAYM
jgi:hypothetical protein